MRKILSLISLIAIVLVLSACNDDVNVLTPKEENVLDKLPDDEITITFWHSFQSENEELMDDFINEFELLYPNITVNSLNQGTPDRIINEVTNVYGTGNLDLMPTLVLTYPYDTAEYVMSNLISPLDDFIYDSNFGVDIDDYILDAVNESKQYSNNNYMYALPYSRSTDILVINKDIFEANGLSVKTSNPYTFTELEELASILVGTGENQCEYLINYENASTFFINSIYQWGGEYITSSGDILLDNDITTSMMNYFKERFNDHTFALPSVWDNYYSSENFKEKDICMNITSSYWVNYNIPLNNEFEVVVAPIPQYNLDNQKVSPYGPNISMISTSTDEEKLAGWLFMKYITNTENSARWAILTSSSPIRSTGYETNIYQNFLTAPPENRIYDVKAAQVAYSQIPYYNYIPVFLPNNFVSSKTVYDESKTAMESLFNPNLTVDEIINNMLENIDYN